MSSGSISFDETRFPLVVITFVGTFGDDVFEAYLAHMDRILARRQVNALVLDASGSGQPTAKQRRRQAEWMKQNHALIRQWSAGAAFVITSPLLRGVLTAILWLQPMPQPHTVVATRTEAERWAREQLRQRTSRSAES